MPEPTPSPPPPGWRQLAAVVAGLTALLVVLLSAFALPPLHSEPHDVPVAVAGAPGDAAAVTEVAADLDARGYAVTAAADADEARALILDREVYGAFVLDATGRPAELLVASAAGNAVATGLRALGAELGADAVTDVRPFPADDPTGAGLSAGALPLALGGWIAAIVLLMTVRGAARQAAGAAGFAVVAGLALTALLRFGFGTFDGAYWATAAAAALGISATAWAILGLRTAIGNAGLAVGAVALILLGNPLSGLASAPELLPAGWGTLGQLLPPGATGSLLRSVAYFDGAGAAGPLLVLACWLAGGVALFALGVRRAQRAAAAAAAPSSEVAA
ncbi:hypothetical protein [Jiangella alkaliphila]|uniref:ABC-2 family transporter protein n=1 Tax=Jiangella alkaliphila TaxID=419479 RepID=A0A1H2LTQ8_9ACTN|nr:hypothetical protein [Jiangella alkaliphila]SDU84105.1 hypothetical protein SAMN04488563_6614 [Jiangella alkaliphila]